MVCCNLLVVIKIFDQKIGILDINHAIGFLEFLANLKHVKEF
jgi:hypothetical protein